ISRTPSTARLLVGIAGVPASGKSTLAQLIVNHINAASRTTRAPDDLDHGKDTAVLISLDGWHLTRAQLDEFPDPKLAHNRRGAHWTFDGEAYVEFVRALRQPHPSPASPDSSSAEALVYAPSFSHELKDPTPRAVPIYPHYRVVVIEGLYTFLGIPPWREAAETLDERWWLEVGEVEAETRLIARHVQSGVAKDHEEAVWRSRENDAPNGKFIKEHILEPTRVIESIEDPVLAPL
ncbi:P-loop containing nucleoside triphosphate hydrolase protein, partial [Amylocystis lapponica]